MEVILAITKSQCPVLLPTMEKCIQAVNLKTWSSLSRIEKHANALFGMAQFYLHAHSVWLSFTSCCMEWMKSTLGAFYIMEYFCCQTSVKASFPLLQMTDIDTRSTKLHNTLNFLCVGDSEKALYYFCGTLQIYLFYINMCVCNSG